jgi:hypothetical protein
MKLLAFNGIGPPTADVDEQSVLAKARNDPNQATLRTKLISARLGYARLLSRRFLDGPARYLMKNDPKTARDREVKVEEEINLALQFSARLWSHRSFVRCLGLRDLRELGLGQYNAHHSMAGLHAICPTDDEEPDFGQAEPILAVIQPAIVAFGTEEGQGYGTVTRPWMKAQVIVAPR